MNSTVPPVQDRQRMPFDFALETANRAAILLLDLGATVRERGIWSTVEIGGFGVEFVRNLFYGRVRYGPFDVGGRPVYAVKVVFNGFGTVDHSDCRFSDWFATAIDGAVRAATARTPGLDERIFEIRGRTARMYRERPSSDLFLLRRHLDQQICRRREDSRLHHRRRMASLRPVIDELLALKESLPTSLKLIRPYGARITKIAHRYYRGDIDDHSAWGVSRIAVAQALLGEIRWRERGKHVR